MITRVPGGSRNGLEAGREPIRESGDGYRARAVKPADRLGESMRTGPADEREVAHEPRIRLGFHL